MTTNVAAYQAVASDAPLEKGTIERRDLRPDDIRIEIEFAGICHSDIHTVREEWGPIEFPMVPGHEIIGRVTEVGSEVMRELERRVVLQVLDRRWSRFVGPTPPATPPG